MHNIIIMLEFIFWSCPPSYCVLMGENNSEKFAKTDLIGYTIIVCALPLH